MPINSDMPAKLAADVLSFTHAWSATPSDYSSLRFLKFLPNGRAELIHGYGQTIFAVCACRWSVPAAGVLRPTELTVTRGQRQEYEPTPRSGTATWGTG